MGVNKCPACMKYESKECVKCSSTCGDEKLENLFVFNPNFKDKQIKTVNSKIKKLNKYQLTQSDIPEFVLIELYFLDGTSEIFLMNKAIAKSLQFGLRKFDNKKGD